MPIERLFVGAMVPGVLLVAVVAGWAAWSGWSTGARRTPFRWREAAGASWEAKWELLLPVVVLGSIVTGTATLVEAAALAVLYTTCVACLVHRELGVVRDLPRVTVECATLLGGFLIILSVALGFTNYLVIAEVPDRVLEWAHARIASPLVFLLALNGFLLVVGALMDIYSAIVVVVPLVLPMALAYGIDPVHLAVIFLANMELGYLMPPMGENLFLSSYRFNRPLLQIYRCTWPYTVILGLAVLLITYVPSLTLWLVEWSERAGGLSGRSVTYRGSSFIHRYEGLAGTHRAQRRRGHPGAGHPRPERAGGRRCPVVVPGDPVGIRVRAGACRRRHDQHRGTGVRSGDDRDG